MIEEKEIETLSEFVLKLVIVCIIVSGIGLFGVAIFNHFGISMNPFSVSEWVWIVIMNFLFILNYHSIVTRS